jgi:hypothetical protein
MHAGSRRLRHHRIADLLTHFAQDLLRMRKGRIARRHTCIDRRLDHHFLHLVRRQIA